MLPLSNADTAWLAEKEDRIKLVSFTGSAKVGWELKAHSGRKRVLLELGGNAALIVHGDWPDLDDAAERTAHAAFGYAGQSCISVQRVFVERSDLPDVPVESGGACRQAGAAAIRRTRRPMWAR